MMLPAPPTRQSAPSHAIAPHASPCKTNPTPARPSSPRHLRPLTRNQLRAARLLVAGQSTNAIAAALRIDRHILAEWKHLPLFQQEICHLIDQTRHIPVQHHAPPTCNPNTVTKLPLILLYVLCASAVNTLAAQPPWDTAPDTWVATDALDRPLPTHDTVGDPKPNRTVGIFYFLWLGQHDHTVFDISKILAENPDAPKWGPPGQFHFWGQPLFGYYQSADEFVLRKHAEMLTDAGVDVIILDVTNAATYPNVYLNLCKVYESIRATGQRTPQLSFLANSLSAKTVQALYDNFYAKNLHPDLWFRWQGKPLLLAPEDGLSPEIRNFFTIRRSWAWTKGQKWFGDGKDRWPWLDHTPQTPGWHDAKDKPEAISVAVAEHPVSNIGRSFHDGKQPAPADRATDQGLYFAQQWKRALEVDPPFVFVTGWNEWVAQRFVAGPKGGPKMLGRLTKPGDTYFVDQFSEEFSRDIEPMTAGHTDNYYYQLVANVRRYKGVRPIPPVTPEPITIDGQFDDWKDVQPEFRDTIDDPVKRDAPGYDPHTHYTNQTGRNDLVAAKVSYDAHNIYFYIRTKNAITPHTDPNWMMLFIDSDHDPKTGWLGYDFVVNRTNVRPTVTTLERSAGGGKYEWGKPADVAYRISGDQLELVIPRSALGISGAPATIDFKWADNIQQTGDPADFTLNGDAAPNDRFNYRAILVKPNN